jgi:16S rRNA (adenine1518-N6/adenine1519-N6)-dimethyltransferase
MRNHKKNLGQHFLNDKNIINKIIAAIKPKITDSFLEIGPGEGALTTPLLDQIKDIILIEKDKDLMPLLQIINSDILKCNLSDYLLDKTRIIGNLPYNISTEIIFKLLSIASNITDIHLMLQKEVVDRMVATPGSKIYGRLSVMTQVYFKIVKLFDISPNVFIPKPKVQSSYIKMVPKISPFDNNNEQKFKELVTIMFTARRKMIKTSLKDYFDENAFKKLSINPSHRPEVLSVEDFLRISKYV